MRLYAMSCGRIRSRKNVFVSDADRNEVIEAPMPVFLITHPEGNILFDTGPYPGVFRDPLSYWGGLAKAFEPIGDERSDVLSQLRNIGLDQKDIKYVVNSHLHFDHAGGNQFFQESTFLVSRKELQSARDPELEGKGYFRADWDHPLDYHQLDGELDIYGDGSVMIIPMPGHTLGHQILLVRLKRQGSIVLSGDSVPCRENFVNFVIPRNNIDDEMARSSVESLHSIVEKEEALLIYGHDPSEWEEVRKQPEFYC